MTGARRINVGVLRAAWWTFQTLRRTRGRLKRLGFDAALTVPPPPRLPRESLRGVTAAMRRLQASCLERAIVLQAWHGAQGDERDLIIGVSSPDRDFRAHAWLDGEAPCHSQTVFHELLRRPLSLGVAPDRGR